MIRTENKPLEEILKSLEGDGKVFLLVCGGCPEGAETTRPEVLEEVEEALRKAGKEVTGRAEVDFLCHKALTLSRLQAPAYDGAWKRADRVLVFSCGIGVAATASALRKPVAPALNTRDLGGMQGKFPSSERCRACGDCMLAYTGGICPVSTCSKQLVNGPCGGTDKGKCEVSQEKDCGWYLIYERLKELGRLDDLKHFQEPRDYSRLDIPDALRRTIWWDLGIEEGTGESEEEKEG